MLPVYAFIGYLILALMMPLCLALVPIWRRARRARHVKCPAFGKPARVALDPWYAVKRNTFGNDELQVREYSEWPACRNCNQECLVQIATAA
jgi:hypothetical protein